MIKTITLELEDTLAANTEAILSDIGLNINVFINMCLKKLAKENGISFLAMASNLQRAEVVGSHTDNSIYSNGIYDNTRALLNRVVIPSKNKITPEMRDCIWDIFINRHSDARFDYSNAEAAAVNQTGINSGSAHIYFLFLNNLVSGASNTRVVKFPDLTVYLENIKSQMPEQYLENAVKSLKASIPYWLNIPNLYSYAKKVITLLDDYR